MDDVLRKAVEAGVPPEVAISAATISCGSGLRNPWPWGLGPWVSRGFSRSFGSQADEDRAGLCGGKTCGGGRPRRYRSS